ncbi:hypothetical protein LWI28_011071 [Acer negundo]|uniref:LYR motif containing domain-containing protein n=1 Tax=Acer negundo TaxID=4023 RepID=A0AAD5JCU4_ACENE|nr:hypothetical protein LWI28_011071 [Acer negundo]
MLALSIAQPAWVQEIEKSYQLDQLAIKTIPELMVKPSSNNGTSLDSSRTRAGQSRPVTAGGGARFGSGRAESTPGWASYGNTGADGGGTEIVDSCAMAAASAVIDIEFGSAIDVLLLLFQRHPHPSLRRITSSIVSAVSTATSNNNPRKASIFHRIRLANSLLRAWAPRPSETSPAAQSFEERSSSESRQQPPQLLILIPGAEKRIVVYFMSLRIVQSTFEDCNGIGEMKSLLWCAASPPETRAQVLSLYRQILRSLNSPKLELSLAARLAKKAEARAIFMLGSEEQSLHNIADLIDAADYSLSLLKQGKIPKHIQ